MNYLVYFKQTGKIAQTSSVVVEDEVYSSIEISFDDMNDFLSDKKIINHYVVVEDGLGRKELLHIYDLEKTFANIDHRLYELPLGSGAQFQITQDSQHKTCLIKIDEFTKLKLGKYNIEWIVLAACAYDPYLPLWVWTVKIQDLINDCATISYAGTDSFRFYTKKILDNYAHELI